MTNFAIELIMNLLPAVILGIVGWITQRNPPKKINSSYGYRTRRAMQSQDAWDFANRMAPRVMLRSAAWLAVIALAVTVLLPLEAAQLVVYGWMIVLVLLDVRRVDNALRNVFNDDGSRK
jgi:uncharacterized membrane protein